jgi:dCMP deaminase
MRQVPSVDEYFINMLPAIAARSKDPHNQVGAVIVGYQGEIRSTGFNGFPTDVVENDYRWSKESGLKYKFVIHAEINAIINAARVGTRVGGCVLYVSFLPCIDCAKAIINAGINTVYVDAANHRKVTSDKWEQDRPLIEAMFRESEVGLYWFEKRSEGK